MELTTKVDNSHAPYVSMLGREEIPIDVAEQSARNLLRLLDDPRVKAARSEVTNEHR